jgi:hypothetical protein
MAIWARYHHTIQQYWKTMRPDLDDTLHPQLFDELLEALRPCRKELRTMINAGITVAACRHPATNSARLIDKQDRLSRGNQIPGGGYASKPGPDDSNIHNMHSPSIPAMRRIPLDTLIARNDYRKVIRARADMLTASRDQRIGDGIRSLMRHLLHDAHG